MVAGVTMSDSRAAVSGVRATHVVYVENSAPDREMVVHVLEAAGGFEVRAMATLPEVQAALADDWADVVLSDYHLDSFTGEAVLDLVVERRAELPVVFVTNTGREDIVADLFRRGASDYVIKDRKHLPRLPGVLQAAVEKAQLQTERTRLHAATQEREKRLRGQREALVQLSADSAVSTGTVASRLRAICTVAADTLGVARVSVWRLERGGASLRCLELCEQSAPMPRGEAVWERADFPAYFAAIEKADIIAAVDAHTDLRTQEFAASYLTPLGIGAMLAAPVRLGGRPEGVLCCEHVGGPRAWLPDEETFAVSLGNFASLVLERHERATTEARLRKSETGLAAAQRLAGLGSWELQFADPAHPPEGTLHWSEELYRVFGFAPGEVEVTNELFYQCVHPDDRAKVRDAVAAALASGNSYSIEHRIVWRDGMERVINERADIVRDANGRAIGLAGTAQDVTERRQIISALHRSVDDFRHLFTHNPMPMWVYDLETLRFLAVNRAAIVRYGYTGAEFLRMTIKDIRPAEDVARLLESLSRRQENFSSSGVWRHRTKRGELLHVRISSHAIKFEGRSAELILAQDVTEELRATEALRESEKRFRTLADDAPVMIWVTDPVGNCTFMGKSWLEFTGQSLADALGFGWLQTVHPEHAPRAKRVFLEANAAGKDFRVDYRLRQKSGEYRWVLAAAVPRRTDTGVYLGYIGSAIDIHDRRSAEQALRESETRFREITETIEEVFWMFDLETARMVYISPSYERIWGQPRENVYADYRCWQESIHPEDRERVVAAIRDRQHAGGYDVEYRIVRPDGAVRWIRDRGFPVHDEHGEIYRLTGVTDDITGRKELAEQLRQVQKMEALGKLSAGVAHDFNNLLSVIKGHLGLLALKGLVTPDIAASIQQIGEAADRASNLTRQLLTFSRQQVMQPAQHNLNGLVANMAKMLRRIVNESIDMQVACSSDVLGIHADEGMVEQVLLNLVVNAGDAMPRGGRLNLTTAAVTITAAELEARPQGRAGDFACLEVSDTGTGIPPAVLHRIFEPFFTTKGVGKGTGLGLATVYGVMQQHQGWIEVESTEGQGTTFRAYFPRVETANSSAGASTPQRLGGTRGGHETILLVEDEQAVREIVALALAGLGYRLVVATCGAEALQLWQLRRHEIDLVLTDLVMPGGVDGRQLAERLRGDAPHLPVIFMSGYSHDVAGDLRLVEGENYLSKPFNVIALATTLRRALDARGAR